MFEGASSSMQLDERMLRVTKLSGEEVASIAVGEVSDVGALKRRLQLPGMPARFRQRLLFNGSVPEDTVELESWGSKEP